MDEQGSYDLISEPWIRVIDDRGEAIEVSLMELVARAPSLRSINGDLPTQDFAILRLVLAILHRALEEFSPADDGGVSEKIEELAAAWPDVVAVVGQYLERYRDRFDLFHPTQPFFQVAWMHTQKEEMSDLRTIIADVPTGHPYLAMRSTRAAQRISAAEAARWLVHTQAFDPSGIKTGVVGHPRAKAGKVYPEGVGWTGQLGGLHLVGATLRDTLLLNLWAVLPSDAEREADLPPWERAPYGLAPSPEAESGSRPAGPVDLYTWQPRRVLLQGGPSGVTGVLVTYGDSFVVQTRQHVVRIEPMGLWRYSKPQSRKFKQDIQMPASHLPAVALWRGLASVVPGQRASKKDEPVASCQIVEHAGRLSRKGSSLFADGLATYRAIGVVYGSNSSVISELIEDSLDLPAAVLDPTQTELRQVALSAVGSAKLGVRALADLARGLARASGASTEQQAGPGDRAYEMGFAALDAPYREWLRTTLADAAEEPTSAEQVWHIQASALLGRLGEELVSRVPDKAWLGFGANGARDDVGAVYQRFRRDLGKAFPRAKPPRSQQANVSTAVGTGSTTDEENGE